jgi:hypothetical protein
LLLSWRLVTLLLLPRQHPAVALLTLLSWRLVMLLLLPRQHRVTHCRSCYCSGGSSAKLQWQRKSRDCKHCQPQQPQQAAAGVLG